jgi:hypothetical protein
MRKGRRMIYKLTIAGAKPLLVREDSKAKATGRVVTVESLTSEQFADEIEAGGKLFKDGDEIEAVEPAEQAEQEE